MSSRQHSTDLVIDRRRCFAPGCKKRAEQWHHVVPRCITKQRSDDLRGAVPLCVKHHAMVTNESVFVRAAKVCWEATTSGRKRLSQLIRAYQDGATFDELSDRFEISSTTVRQVLLRNGIALRTRGELTRAFTEKQKDRIASEYIRGDSIEDLCIAYGTSDHPIYAALRERRVPTRYCRAFTNTEALRIRRDYESPMSVPDLAHKYGRSRQTIISTLRRLGAKMRTYSESQALRFSIAA